MKGEKSMHFSPRLLKLSGITLAGILLTGSISVQSTFQTSVADSAVKPITLTSNYLYSSPNRTQLLHQPLNRNIVAPTIVTIASEMNYLQTKNVPNENISPENSSQLVHIAQAVGRETQTQKKQVSRGSSESSKIVEHALSLLGTPYVFGGISKKGFDCSGFTQYILAGSGIALPRTSYSQFSSGVAVSKNDLSPGDLVFFRTYSKGASHVGIYIGGGRFVHANNPRVGVTVTSLSDSYYSSRYLGARRYI